MANNFDITLLTVLLRNICGLPAPATGWDDIPISGDTSKSADIVRIRIFRNEIYGHIRHAQLDHAKFNTLWQEISRSLIRLGILQNDIDEIKMAPLSFEVSRNIYNELRHLRLSRPRQNLYHISQIVFSLCQNHYACVHCRRIFTTMRKSGEREEATCHQNNFDCLLVAEERYNTIGKSDEDFISKMEEIKKEFDTHYDDLKNDKSLCAHYYYQDGRYLCRISRNNTGREELELQTQAREQLKKLLEPRKTLTETPEGEADNVFLLLQLGKICKTISSAEYHLNERRSSKTSLKQAKEYYREAIQLSVNYLGDHELTSSCYKHSGDLFFKTKEFQLAENEYTTAKTMREKLDLDASEKYAFILKNLGGCLTESKRANEAIEVLEKACDIVEKLPESAKLQNVWLKRAHTSLAIAYDLVQKKSEAVYYANKAMEITSDQEKIISKYLCNKLKNILKDSKN